MEIRSIAVDDEAPFAASYQVIRAAELAELADLPFWSQHEAAVIVRGDKSERFELYGAYEHRRIVGTSFIALSQLDNLDKAWVGVFVAPDDSRRGAGSALVEHLKQRATQAGRTTLLTESRVGFDRRDDHPYRRFANKHGFELASVEVSRVLHLPVDDDEISGWLDKSEPHRVGYRIETHLDHMPDALVPSLVDVVNQLVADAPTGSIDFEAGQRTPEVWQERRAALLEQGRHPIVTVALDAAGQVVAMTQIVIPPEDRPKAYQFATIVRREHRGHRLGLAIKATNLRRLQELYPERTQLWTSNEETNGPMLDINVTMGFVPHHELLCFQWKAADAR